MIRRACFTFLEVMIAVSIMLVVTVTLFTYSGETTRSWQKIIQARGRFGELMNFDRTIHQIFTHAVPFTWKNQDKERVNFLLADRDRLRCAYLHSLNDETEGAIRFIEIYLEDGNLVMQYTDRPFLDWENVRDRTRTCVLLKDIKEIRFSYADWSDQQDDKWEDRLLWTDYWETEESQRMDIPLAIMLHVLWQDGREECWLRRTMGNSYRERFGTWNPHKQEERGLP